MKITEIIAYADMEEKDRYGKYIIFTDRCNFEIEVDLYGINNRIIHVTKNIYGFIGSNIINYNIRKIVTDDPFSISYHILFNTDKGLLSLIGYINGIIGRFKFKKTSK